MVKLSTKSRYAVTAMVDLARLSHVDTTATAPVTLNEISERQLLPLQYLEQLFAKLRKADLVQSVRGQAGGYFLNRAPHSITIAEIIQAVGEDIQATGCKLTSQSFCNGHKTYCMTHDLWSGLSKVMHDYLNEVTLSDVIMKKQILRKSV